MGNIRKRSLFINQINTAKIQQIERLLIFHTLYFVFIVTFCHQNSAFLYKKWTKV